jgi:integrase
MEKLADNDRAIRGCRTKPGQSRTRWTVDGRKGLYVDVSVKAGAPTNDSDRQRDDFRRVYYLRDQRKGGGFVRLDDVERLSLSQAWKAVTDRSANLTLTGRRSGKVTFGSLFDDWLARHAKQNKKSWAQDEAMYERHVKKHLGSAVVDDLKRGDFVDVLDKIAKTASGVQANRAQALITAVLNWAVAEDKIDDHPARGIRKRVTEKSRERVLSSDELKKWWSALGEHATPRSARLLKLLLLTGVRLSEACGMERAELQGDLWEIPGARTKSGLPHVVPLSPTASKLVADAISEVGSSPYVFPAFDRHRMMEQPVTRHAPDHAYARLAVKLKFIDTDGKPNTGIHDLRRTVATNLGRLGVPTDLINRIQGRRAGDRVGAIYNRHEYLAERRDALERWEREVLRIVRVD